MSTKKYHYNDQEIKIIYGNWCGVRKLLITSSSTKKFAIVMKYEKDPLVILNDGKISLGTTIKTNSYRKARKIGVDYVTKMYSL